MLIKEYRVVLPLTVEEYRIAQLYSVAQTSKKETGGGEGVEVVKNEPFSEFPLLGGKYNSAPKGSLEICEEAWNAYPYCRTVISNPGYMKDNFCVVIESFHIADRGKTPNVHQLDAAKLKQREVVYIDIGNDPVSPADFDPELDPASFKSVKTGRGPLTGDWINTDDPVMTCYKLVYAEFKWFGLQNRIETFIHKSQRRLFTAFHRQLFCWIDEWYGLTMSDIRELEERTKRELERQILEGEVRGMQAEPE